MSKRIFILVDSLGHADAVLPLVITARRRSPGAQFQFVVLSRAALESIRRSTFLHDLIKIHIENVILLDMSGRYKLSPYFWVAFAFLLMRLLLARGSILIHARDFRCRFLRPLHAAVKLTGGKTYGMFSSMVLNIGRLPVRAGERIDVGNGFLAFSRHDVSYLKAKGIRTEIEFIGYPRLYNEWLDLVRIDGRRYFEAEFHQYGIREGRPVIFVLLGSIVPRLFNGEEFEGWLRTVIDVTIDCYNDPFIILKPHPKLRLWHLHAVLESYRDIDIVVSDLHTAILAFNASVVVSHHTSAILDALFLNPRTIHFMQFTRKWMESDPTTCTVFKEIVPYLATTEQELRTCFGRIGSASGLSNLIEKLAHAENITPLLR